MHLNWRLKLLVVNNNGKNSTSPNIMWSTDTGKKQKQPPFCMPRRCWCSTLILLFSILMALCMPVRWAATEQPKIKETGSYVLAFLRAELIRTSAEAIINVSFISCYGSKESSHWVAAEPPSDGLRCATWSTEILSASTVLIAITTKLVTSGTCIWYDLKNKW